MLLVDTSRKFRKKSPFLGKKVFLQNSKISKVFLRRWGLVQFQIWMWPSSPSTIFSKLMGKIDTFFSNPRSFIHDFVTAKTFRRFSFFMLFYNQAFRNVLQMAAARPISVFPTEIRLVGHLALHWTFSEKAACEPLEIIETGHRIQKDLKNNMLQNLEWVGISLAKMLREVSR